jgi:hypothetical protein
MSGIRMVRIVEVVLMALKRVDVVVEAAQALLLLVEMTVLSLNVLGYY